MDKDKLLALTTDIVSSHASMNEMTQEALIQEIGLIYAKLASLAGVDDDGDFPPEGTPEAPTELKPAVPLQAAFGADQVFCMVCGLGLKTLKRHLGTAHGLKPGAYRKQFGIPSGTALVAKNYSDSRKALAKDMNLAERLTKARAVRSANRAEKAEGVVPVEIPAEVPVKEKKTRGKK